ncbi:MAG: DUF4197 family protein [Candidatus Latescibacteria bacterium]|nr:DUF4197 family protein [Candidatus Latescibacterota bacterium]NIO57265.1 DUF4197 family protein [Candidatus Latescibacterota bacterium]
MSRMIDFLILVLLISGCAGLKSDALDAISRAGQDAPLDERTVAAGLKEALRIGTERTVASTSKLDGFLGNALIRIVIPEEFEKAANTLRSVGLGKQVDKFAVGMNRAAERAAGEAIDIFWNAITRMTLADAFGILNGGETAATDYFRDRTEGTLRTRFMPIVRDKMSEVGLYQVYNELTDYYNKLPMVTEPALDLDEYITDRALYGLFTILGQEEKRIRQDPLARTTELLRRVFGKQ